MKDEIMRKFILNLILVSSLFLVKNDVLANYLQPWQINTSMKFNISYLYDGSASLDKQKKEKLAPIFEPSYMPDATNIKISKLISLGFDLPIQNNPDNYNLFLKFYKFPNELSNSPVTDEFLKTFGLNYSTFYTEIGTYISNKNNLMIDMAYIAPNDTKFSKTNPFPPFLITKNKKLKDSNNYILNQIPFYLIYLEPTVAPKANLSIDERAVWSRIGVLGFSENIISYYKRNFLELAGQDKDYYYFWMTATPKQKYVLLKMPKQPLLLDNWKDLPTPYDSKHKFLTSLLLIYSIEYKARGAAPAIIPAVDSDEFNNAYKKGKTKVFKIGSVVDVK